MAKSSEVTAELMSSGDMPLKPQVYQVGDRSMILYRGAVAVGNVYMAKDVTAEQRQLIAAIQGLTAVCILATIFTILAIAIRIRRSLQPLQEMIGANSQIDRRRNGCSYRCRFLSIASPFFSASSRCSLCLY
jgi:hypothetical protein